MTGHLRTNLFLAAVFVQALVIVQTGSPGRPPPSLQDALLSYMCRGENSRICSGNGVCRNGNCYCHDGYNGSKCEVSEMETLPAETTTESLTTMMTPTVVASCSSEETNACNGHGVCEEGLCRCDPLWSGFRCELSMKDGFCKTYLECAECTALITSCPEKCKTQANFQLVFGFKSGPTFHRCKQRNAERNCVFYYQLWRQDSRGFKDIQVKACLPSSPQAVDTTTDDDINKMGDQDRNKGGPGSGATKHDSSVVAVVSVLLILHFRA